MNSEGILEYMKIMTILNTQYCFQINAAAAAKSHQSCPTLCNPVDSSPQAPLSLGFSRQEYWKRLLFPTLNLEDCCC